MFDLLGRVLGRPTPDVPGTPSPHIAPFVPIGGGLAGARITAALTSVDLRRAHLHGANLPAELGRTNRLTREGYAIIEFVGSPETSDGRFPRIAAYGPSLERLAEWAKQYKREILEIEPILARREHVKGSTSDGIHYYVRYRETDDLVAKLAADPSASPRSVGAIDQVVEQASRACGPARFGFVTKNGLIIQIHDRIFSRSAEDEAIPRANQNYLLENGAHEERMGGAKRLKYTYAVGLAEHVRPGMPTVAFTGMQIWKTKPDLREPQFEQRAKLPRLPHSAAPGNIEAEAKVEAGVVASRGYRMPDGSVWRFIGYRGPPPGGDNYSTAQQERRFAEIITDVFDRQNVVDVKNLHYFRNWGSHTKATQDNSGAIQGFYFGCLVRCEDGPSADAAPSCPPPRSAFSTIEISAAGYRAQNKKSEHGVIGPKGEGFSIIEYFAAPERNGEITVEQQWDEFLRRIGDWMQKYPEREILETAFNVSEAPFITPQDKGYRYRMVLRFNETNFKPDQATKEVPKPALSTFELVSAEMKRQTLDAYAGYEHKPGYGNAIIHFFTPPPIGNEIGVREGNWQGLLHLNEWMKAHPDRRIVEFTPFFRWDNPAVPVHSGNSFEHSWFVRYEPISGKLSE